MGQSASSSTPLAVPELALHCLRVADGSPADTLLEPFFDYVVGVDAASGPNTPTDELALEGQGVGELVRVVEQNEGSTVVLRVYNAKTQRVREVAVVPSRNWGDASDGGQKSLLGLTMRVCNPAQALESVWHILEVLEGSPAEHTCSVTTTTWEVARSQLIAGLVPFGDWVCGWAGGPLHTENSFYELVEAHIDKPLRLYVYSADLECVSFVAYGTSAQLTSSNLREVVVIPNEKWGGSGLLGCGVGYGILHRIPRPATPPARTDNYFVPAAQIGGGSAGLPPLASASSTA